MKKILLVGVLVAYSSVGAATCKEKSIQDCVTGFKKVYKRATMRRDSFGEITRSYCYVGGSIEYGFSLPKTCVRMFGSKVHCRDYSDECVSVLAEGKEREFANLCKRMHDKALVSPCQGSEWEAERELPKTERQIAKEHSWAEELAALARSR